MNKHSECAYESGNRSRTRSVNNFVDHSVRPALIYMSTLESLTILRKGDKIKVSCNMYICKILLNKNVNKTIKKKRLLVI